MFVLEGISWLIVIGFFVNLIPFVLWVNKQKPTSEFMMYQVRGRFSYFTVLAWLDAIENGLGKTLNRKRIQLANWQVISSQKRRSYAVFKPHIEKTLYLASFGVDPRSMAFSRMRLYSKIVYIWSLVILFIPINFFVFYFYKELSNYIIATIVGVIVGIVPGLMLFNLVKKIFNSILNSVANFRIRKKGDAGYLHELMHQFSGIYNGHWNTVDWNDTEKTKITGLDTTNETLDYIKFNLFKGKGSQGNW